MTVAGRIHLSVELLNHTQKWQDVGRVVFALLSTKTWQ